MKLPPARLSPNQGLALGPILFIIAILVLIAAAIAANSGAFTISMSTESTKVEASKIIEFGNRVNQAVNLMEERYGVPDYGWGQQHAGNGWSSQCNSTNCTIWCDSYYGGSQNCVTDLTLQSSDFIAYNQAAHESADIYLTLIKGVGTSSKGQIVMEIGGLTKTVCTEINRQLGFGAIAPVEGGYANSQYQMPTTTITDPTGNPIGTTATQFIGATTFCVGSGSFSSTDFEFINVLMMR